MVYDISVLARFQFILQDCTVFQRFYFNVRILCMKLFNILFERNKLSDVFEDIVILDF